MRVCVVLYHIDVCVCAALPCDCFFPHIVICLAAFVFLWMGSLLLSPSSPISVWAVHSFSMSDIKKKDGMIAYGQLWHSPLLFEWFKAKYSKSCVVKAQGYLFTWHFIRLPVALFYPELIETSSQLQSVAIHSIIPTRGLWLWIQRPTLPSWVCLGSLWALKLPPTRQGHGG